MTDMVNHPPHYQHGGKECIEWLEDFRLGYHDGNAFKYLYRHRHKAKPKEDLKKAVWYLTRHAKRVGNAGVCRRVAINVYRGVVMQGYLDTVAELNEYLEFEGASELAMTYFLMGIRHHNADYLHRAINYIETIIKDLDDD